jgi:hypothetical protein
LESIISSNLTLKQHAVKIYGLDYATKFSKNINIDEIKIICMLGEGSFAKVFLVEML